VAAGWSPEHPSFDAFTSGLLASPRVPWHLHMAAALNKIQRKPLAGFNDETFCWESVERGIERVRAKLGIHGRNGIRSRRSVITFPSGRVPRRQS
jgi:hypothetical protein